MSKTTTKRPSGRRSSSGPSDSFVGSVETCLLAAEVGALFREMLKRMSPPLVKGEEQDPHEDNTHGLPNGKPIRQTLKKWFKKQAKEILGTIPTIGKALPSTLPSVTNYDDPMAAAMTPLISAYWDQAGKTTRAKLGLDTEEWRVTDPHLEHAIQTASLKFCAQTNATTTGKLQDALATLRTELHQGLVEEGESLPQLRKRVQKVFWEANDYRAGLIARTEASRAVHTASNQSAKESGVVAGRRLLASANACEECLAIVAATPEGGYPLDSSEGMPPIHPQCRCSTTFVLSDEYAKLLDDDGPPAGATEPGPLGPEPTPTPPVEPAKPAPEPELPRPWQPRPDSDFRKFHDIDAIEQWGNAHYAKWAKSITDSQRGAIEDYSAEHYKWINGYLRSGVVPDVSHSQKEAVAAAKRITQALNKARTPEPITVGRGIDNLKAMGYDINKIAPGQVMVENGFVSTTLKPEGAGYGGGRGGAYFEIHVPAGTRGGYLNAGDISRNPVEREFLMPFGTQYRVISVDKSGFTPKIKVEVVA